MLGFYSTKLKEFTRQLFLSESFDSFLVSEAQFVTSYTTDIDGRLLTKDAGEAYVSWGTLRPIAFSLIKGKTLPRSFSVVFALSKEKTAALLERSGLDYRPDDVGGLFLNIRYGREQLAVTGGVSLKAFTPDKSLEQLWDKQLLRFLGQLGLDEP